MKQDSAKKDYETERKLFSPDEQNIDFYQGETAQIELKPKGNITDDIEQNNNKIHVEQDGPLTKKNGISYNPFVSIQVENPIKISFRNIEFDALVTKKNAEGVTVQTIKILNKVSGVALPGETLYIMGSSGSGKTSLLNLLSDRVAKRRGMSMGGEAFLNDDTPLTMENFGKVGAYVMQDDILFAQFTPLEAIRFAARLKLTVPISEQERRIQELIDDLGLEDSQNTMIGSTEKKGISGGQRKRTSIAVELVTNPSILFLDEPTSGLDSFNALIIVKMLDRLARQGKTVLSTLHQPSSDAFRLFNRLILMVEGNIIYQGYAKDSPQYFESIGAPVALYQNPADHYMRILSLSFQDENLDMNQRKVEYLISQYNKVLANQVLEDDEKFRFEAPDFVHQARKKAGYCTQIKQLMVRNGAWLQREPKVLKLKLFQAVILGLSGLAVFWNLKVENFQDLMNMAGCLQFSCISAFMQLLGGTILVFQQERPVFLREQANQMYSIQAYYQAKVMAEMPIVILTPFLYSSILYFGIGLTITASQFFAYTFIMFLLMVCSMAMGYFLSSLFENAATAATTYTVFAMPLILFGGLIANSSTIASWISWFQYISPVRYSFEAMMRNEFEGRTIGDAIIDPMDMLGFDIGFWNCVYILIGQTVFYRIMALIMLKVLLKRFQ